MNADGEGYVVPDETLTLHRTDVDCGSLFNVSPWRREILSRLPAGSRQMLPDDKLSGDNDFRLSHARPRSGEIW